MFDLKQARYTSTLPCEVTIRRCQPPSTCYGHHHGHGRRPIPKQSCRVSPTGGTIGSLGRQRILASACEDWLRLVELAEHPVTGVAGALTRLYIIK